MNKKIILIIALTILSVFILFAEETGKLAGKVSNEEGKSIASANVIIEGTKLGS